MIKKISSILISLSIFSHASLSFPQTMVNIWEGTSAEAGTYRYTIDVNFAGVTDAYANMVLLQSIETSTFSQVIQNQTITYSIEPTKTTPLTDEQGNMYVKAEWQTPVNDVQITREAEVSICAPYGPFVTSTPYPISSDLIPEEIATHLQPTGFCQSDAPEIINLADSLVENSFSEADAVVKIINWVRYHMRWICTCEMPFLYSDALNTLTCGGGNCVNFGNLAVALLRAADIPAREINGHLIHEWSSSGGHRWVEVYYPDKGWIQYETAYWMPNEGPLAWTFLIPRHIKITSGPGPGPSSGDFLEEHYTVSTVTSSPSSIQETTSSIVNNRFVTHLITVKNTHPYETDTIHLATSSTSDDWHVSLSQDFIFIDPQDLWENTRDITVTIAPLQNSNNVDRVTVTVSATSQNTGLTESVIFHVSNAPVQITAVALDTAEVGMAYSDTLEASGGTTPYLWYLISGPLPTGLQLENTQGVIHGIPDEIGTFPFFIKVVDSQQPATADTMKFVIHVKSPAYIDNDHSSTLPTESALYQNYPNPFNSKTTIPYQVGESGYVSINIYDAIGQKVRTLVDQNKTANSYSVIWDGKNDWEQCVASGVYFYKMKIGDFYQKKKFLLLR